MSQQLASDVEYAINERDSTVAYGILLERDVNEIPLPKLEKLVEIAREIGDVHDYYLRVVNVLSVAQKMVLAQAVGKTSPAVRIGDMLAKDESEARRDTMVNAYLEDIDEDLVELYPKAIGRVSVAVQAALNKAVVGSDDIDTSQLAEILEKHAEHRDAIIAAVVSHRSRADAEELIVEGGKHLTDVQLLKLARAAQNR